MVARVRDILLAERADVLTSYDSNGIYGHIDHVQVHEVGRRAVRGTACELVEATLDRSLLRRMRAEMLERGLDPGRWPSDLNERLGLEAGPRVVGVDVRDHLETKMAAIAAHSSQVVEAPAFMGVPAGAFHHLLATEWFSTVRPVGDGPAALLVAARPGGAPTGRLVPV